MEKDFLKKSFAIAKIHYSENEPLANKTTFKIGNTAELFLKPATVSQLQSCIGGAAAANENYFVLGGGSNIVFPDEPFTGTIISTSELNNISMTDDDFQLPETLQNENPLNYRLVTCECGVPMATFVNFCTNHNLSGAEQFAGLPGSIGGAVYMNARCFEKSISDIIYKAEFIELQPNNTTKLFEITYDASEWDYKKSPFQNNNRVVTSATFLLKQTTSENHSKIEEACKKYISERVDKGHFKYPSAGSVFKNNHAFGAPSGKLIDECGLKGTNIGGAQIAPFHGNFIINVNNATQKDIKELVKLSQKKVEEKFGFLLETEIIFVENKKNEE